MLASLRQKIILFGLSFLGFIFLFQHPLMHPSLIRRLQKTLKVFILGQQADEVILVVWSSLTSPCETVLKHHVWANQNIFHSIVVTFTGLYVILYGDF